MFTYPGYVYISGSDTKLDSLTKTNLYPNLLHYLPKAADDEEKDSCLFQGYSHKHSQLELSVAVLLAAELRYYSSNSSRTIRFTFGLGTGIKPFIPNSAMD